MLADQGLQTAATAQRFGGQIMMAAIQHYLMGRQIGRSKAVHVVQGEQSLKELSAQGKELKREQVHEKDLQTWRRELKRYEVDFHIMQVPGKDTYYLFFKAQDIDRVNLGLGKCVEEFKRPPLSEQLEAAAKEAASHNAQRAAEPAMEKAAAKVAEKAAEAAL